MRIAVATGTYAVSSRSKPSICPLGSITPDHPEAGAADADRLAERTRVAEELGG